VPGKGILHFVLINSSEYYMPFSKDGNWVTVSGLLNVAYNSAGHAKIILSTTDVDNNSSFTKNKCL